jgi:hypothetical protein
MEGLAVGLGVITLQDFPVVEYQVKEIVAEITLQQTSMVQAVAVVQVLLVQMEQH